MVHSAYRYQLDLFAPDGAAMGRAALSVDWEPAREWTRFAAVRSGRIAAGALDTHAAVEPVWHATAGQPYVDGISVLLAVDGVELRHVFDAGYFAAAAQAALRQLTVRQGEERSSTLRYVTTAYRSAETSPEAARSFSVRELAPPLEVEDGSLETASGASPRRHDPHLERDGDMPVFIPARVVGEAAALTAMAGAKETGGILIGRLCRDRGQTTLFAEVTAQVPARHTEADLTMLTFTPDTWTDVRHAIALRGRREVMLGWWHSHPVREWCKGCPPERQRVCTLGTGFLSAHDRALHRTVFPRAYSLALVVSDVAGDGPAFTLFGWREAVLDTRGFITTGEE